MSSLLFFRKIHCGTMYIDKDKYLTPSLHSSVCSSVWHTNDVCSLLQLNSFDQNFMKLAHIV